MPADHSPSRPPIPGAPTQGDLEVLGYLLRNIYHFQETPESPLANDWLSVAASAWRFFSTCKKPGKQVVFAEKSNDTGDITVYFDDGTQELRKSAAHQADTTVDKTINNHQFGGEARTPPTLREIQEGMIPGQNDGSNVLVDPRPASDQAPKDTTDINTKLDSQTNEISIKDPADLKLGDDGDLRSTEGEGNSTPQHPDLNGSLLATPGKR